MARVVKCFVWKRRSLLGCCFCVGVFEKIDDSFVLSAVVCRVCSVAHICRRIG